jgi:hypothetical protein
MARRTFTYYVKHYKGIKGKKKIFNKGFSAIDH